MFPFEETVTNFKGFNMTDLELDEAWLNISSSFSVPVWLYILSDDCDSCPFSKLLDEPILSNHSYRKVINVRQGSTFRFRISGDSDHPGESKDSFKLCDIKRSLGEFGVYNLHIEESTSEAFPRCEMSAELPPVNIYWPIVAVTMFWLLVTLIMKNGVCINQLFKTAVQKIVACTLKWQENQSDTRPIHGNGSGSDDPPNESSLNSEGSSDVLENPVADRRHKSHRILRRKRTAGAAVLTQETDETPCINTPLPSTSLQESGTGVGTDSQPLRLQKDRLKSLDAFRGLCLLIMIFVDDGGGGYYFFQHSTWNGLYLADFAFPWFLWICGVCIPVSINSRLGNGYSNLKICKEILIRSLKLICLGILVNTSTKPTAVHLENLRLPGVLQRFGICYFLGSTMFLLRPHATSNNNSIGSQEPQQTSTRNSYFKDIRMSITGWCFAVACVILHTSLIFTLPVSGCPTGYLGPAGLHNNNAYPPHCVGGAAGYVDRLIFGIHHVHNRPTSKNVYGSGAFDPEGMLGILTSILHIWLGVQTGTILLAYKDVMSRVWRFVVWSLICGVGGLVLCGGYVNQGLIPVNKNLWSLSFVLITSSAALIVLAALYLVIDVQKLWSGSPLIETGMNSILLYLGHEVCHAMLPWHFSYGPMRTHFSRLIESTWGTSLWIFIAVHLHDRQLFFAV